MRLLDKYLFRELLAPLAYCLGGILIVGVSGTLFNQLDELQKAKLHFLDVVEYSIAITPEFLVTTLPVILLLGLLYALTNHARANEITAMRAAGVGLWRICVPYFAAGIAASVILFALNEFLVPRSAAWAGHILTRYTQKPGDPDVNNEFRDLAFKNEHNARESRTWFIGEYLINTAEMIKPQVSRTSPDGSIRLLRADRAIRINGVWTFYNAAEYSQAGATAPLVPSSLQTNVLAMPEFDETPAQINGEIKIADWLSLGVVQKADIPLAEIRGYLRLHPNLSRSTSGPLLTELHGRLAAPWTCLGVVFIAIPFGVAPGRRNLFVGVAGSIAICFTYFVIQKVSLACGSQNYLPAWLAAWLPNLIFSVTGLILMARVR